MLSQFMKNCLRTVFIKVFIIIGPVLNEWKKYHCNCKSLVIVRHGGIGDLLFISSLIANISKINPAVQISLITNHKYHSIFNGLHYISNLYDYYSPGALKALFSYESIIFLDNAIESNVDAEKVNIYDLLNEKYAGITCDNKQKKPYINVDENSVSYLLRTISLLSKNKKKIGIQLLAGSPVRTPDIDFWFGVISSLDFYLPRCGIVLICDAKYKAMADEICIKMTSKGSKIEFVNFGAYSRSVKDLVALIGLLDLVICPDSSVVHIAAAYGIPTISVYGPFPSTLRTKYYVNNFSFDAVDSCSPCFTHGHDPCKFAVRGSSPCFNNIERQKLYKKIEDMLSVIVPSREISTLVNIHNNIDSCCYIIGKGPSLDLFDMDELKNSVVFCLNDTYKLVENPDFIFYHDAVFSGGISTNSENSCKWILPRLLNDADGTTILCSDYINLDTYENVYLYNKYHTNDLHNIDHSIDDIDNILFSKSGTIQSAIHFAYKLGFEKIRLVGIDGGPVMGKVYSEYFDFVRESDSVVDIYRMIKDDSIILMDLLGINYEFIT